MLKLGGKLDKCPENGGKPKKLGSSGSAFPLDNPKKGKTLISFIFRRISRRMKVKVTSKRKFTRKAGSAAKTEGPMAESSRPSAPTSGTETLGKAGAGPLGKAASAGTEATAAVAAVTSVTAVTSAPAAAVTAVTSAVPGPKGPVAGPSGAAGSGTTPEDNRACLSQMRSKGSLSLSFGENEWKSGQGSVGGNRGNGGGGGGDVGDGGNVRSGGGGDGGDGGNVRCAGAEGTGGEAERGGWLRDNPRRQ